MKHKLEDPSCHAVRLAIRTTFVLLPAVLLLVAANTAWTKQPAAPQKNQVLLVPSSRQPLYLSLEMPDNVASGATDRWQLVEEGPEKLTVPVLIARDNTSEATADHQHHAPRLLATIPAGGTDAVARRFRLVAAAADKPSSSLPGFHFVAVDKRSLSLLEGESPRLVYNHGTIVDPRVPKQDSRRQRSCYMHPVWGVHGEVLTDDFPQDHYHHHGLFWTWPHVKIGDKSYSLWTDQGIAQQFVRWLQRDAGPAGARLGVENHWVVDGQPVMVERVWVEVYPGQRDSLAMDLHFTWIPVGRPITLQGAAGKSYGGLTMRFAVRDPGKVTITTPSGVSPDDLPDTRLPWADLTTTFEGQSTPSGAAIFVPPDHPDFPPTWLLRHYGPLCVGWPGVRAKTFPAGQPFHLSYRVWIHDGQPTAGQIEQAYQAYTKGLTAKWLSSQAQTAD